MARHKLYEPYEEPKGSGQWFFDVPGDELKLRIQIGPYETKDHAEFDSGEAEALSDT